MPLYFLEKRQDAPADTYHKKKHESVRRTSLSPYQVINLLIP